ncbi:MAG TPA: hypothetical protein VM536_05505 [Chloroflexia bacterium]|nr:hypothetical protein [Chloroflexia bacterium]
MDTFVISPVGWMAYLLITLGISGLVGRHVGRFDDACTEMTGMMTGMVMGMLNGLLVGYAAAAATASMFWGNLIGILLGLVLGGYYGRGGALMGVMDGAMGGVMGGSMGAMLAIMVTFPEWALAATAVLLSLVYVAGMIALVVLIEQRAPTLAGAHRLAPLFARRTGAGAPPARAGSGLMNYYEMLDIPVKASSEQVAQAYLMYIEGAADEARAVAAVALAVLTDPTRRAQYNKDLAVASGLGECCPPPRRSPSPAAASPPHTAGDAPARSAKGMAGGHTRVPPPPIRRGPDWRIGMFALIPLFLILGAMLVSRTSTPAPLGDAYPGDPNPAPTVSTASAAALEARAVPATEVNGLQVLNLVVNGDTMSYKPSVLKVKQGRPVQVNLSVEGRDPG